MKIVIDDKIPFIEGVLEPFGEVKYIAGASISPFDVKDADALVLRTRTKCDESLLSGSKVKFIATATIGYDHIDFAYCAKNAIAWTNAPGCNANSVGQYITSALLNLSLKHKFDLSKMTLGVIGVGNVGSKVVKIAENLGMRVLQNDPPRENQQKINTCKTKLKNPFCGLRKIINEADIITMHVPLERAGDYPTFHLVDDDFLKSLKPGAILINSSRGPVVDNMALKLNLQSSHLRGAVLDVWEGEPHIDLKLLDLVDIATPHIAGYSADGKANGTSMSIQALSKFFDFGIDEWFPDNVPLTANNNLIIDSSNKSSIQVLQTAVFASYNIMNDDYALRSNPETFEILRGEYGLRREFHAFSLNHKVSDEALAYLRKFGFKV